MDQPDPLSVELGFWISIDSGIRNFGSVFRIPKHGFPIPREKIPGFQISDSLTLDTTSL